MKDNDVQQLYDDILFSIEALVTNQNLNEAKIREIGVDLAFEAIYSSSGTYYEAMGMIEKVKDLYKKSHNEMLERLRSDRRRNEILEEVPGKD